MYVARTLDMFVSVRALTIKSTISTFVESEELGMLNVKLKICPFCLYISSSFIFLKGAFSQLLES